MLPPTSLGPRKEQDGPEQHGSDEIQRRDQQQGRPARHEQLPRQCPQRRDQFKERRRVEIGVVLADARCRVRPVEDRPSNTAVHRVPCPIRDQSYGSANATITIHIATAITAPKAISARRRAGVMASDDTRGRGITDAG